MKYPATDKISGFFRRVGTTMEVKQAVNTGNSRVKPPFISMIRIMPMSGGRITVMKNVTIPTMAKDVNLFQGVTLSRFLIFRRRDAPIGRFFMQ